MGQAASNGHLDVGQFSIQIVKRAVQMANRPERFSHNLVKWITRCDGSYDKVLLNYALYGDQYLLRWYADELIECADFETVEVLNARAQANGVAHAIELNSTARLREK